MESIARSPADSAAFRPAPANPDRGRAAPIAVWLLCWVVLPNLCFVLLWMVAVPPRGFVIVLTALVGLVLRSAGYWLRVGAFALLIAFAGLSYLASLFSVSVDSLIGWGPYLREMHAEQSSSYVAGVLGLATTVVAGAVALRGDARFSGTRATCVAAAGVLFMAGADYVVSHSATAFYGRLPSTDAIFSSGVRRSGFASASPARRHLLLVMVESLGLPRDPAMMAALIRPFRSAAITRRYRMTMGDTPYYGSTTNGEMRALCGRWTGFEALAHTKDAGCLPAQLARHGYQTTAFHSFDRAMFDREHVYPHLGFQVSHFSDSLIAAGAEPCPGIFPGACDRDVPALIARQLLQARQPQFIYWLTVNSHLPVLRDARLHTDACPADVPAGVEQFAMICRQFVLWREVLAALAVQLARPDMPPVDVLIVGDHMPPYFDLAQRSQFDPQHVPWIMLSAHPAGGDTAN